MPQRTLCKECGEVLYVGLLLKSPRDVVKQFEGKCPKCEKDLAFEADAVTVKSSKN